MSSAVAIAADLPTPYGAITQPPVPVAPQMWGWEVRGGVLAHDPTSPEKGSADLNGELLFPQLWHASNPFWNQFIPHPDVGFTANFAGKTSQAYAGLAWNFDLTHNFFFSGVLGGGVNNGKTGDVVPPGHNKVGCNEWFHESASLGYQLTEAWSVMGTIEHSSNAGLCTQNRGVTNYGLRLGYRF
jgi:hypothetical protein